MKLLLTSLLITSSLTFAVKITNAHFDVLTKKIELEVEYSGGCGEHMWGLTVDKCLTIKKKLSCDVVLLHVADDPCELLHQGFVGFSLEEANLSDDKYSGAELRLFSEEFSKEEDIIKINLPKLN